MSYSFDQIFAVDESNPERVAANGVVTIFAPGDESRTPLLITTVEGMAIQNPVMVNDSGHGPAFMHATLDRVAWEGGGFSGFFTSYEGMKQEAVAARISAGDAAVAAIEAAANSTAPTAEAVEREIVTEGTPARTAVELVAGIAATEAAAQVVAPKLDKVEAASTYAVKPDNGGKPVGQGELDYNQFTRAYRKKIIHHLPFKHAGYESAKALWGDYYPQGFAVDEVADELFVSSQPTAGTYCVVTVYKWSTGELKTTFAYVAAYGSEGAVVLREGGRRYLYGRVLEGLGRVDITTLPPLNSVAPVVNTYATNQGINFTHRNGVWTVADNTPPIGGQVSRGSFKRLDSSFNYVGSMFVEERLIGGNPAAYRQSVMPKMQGFAEGAGCYLIAVGGFAKKGAAFDNYGLNGIRVLTGQGKSVVDSLADPHRMMEVLDENGVPCTRLENEGVQLVGGKIVTLQVTDNSSSTGGILFLEEFSDSTSAIDFSSCAYTWTMPDVTSMQSGMQPRASNNKLYNQATAEPLTSMQQITEYMTAVGQNIFRFYSSNVSILDLDGTPIAGGYLVTTYNCNNSTYRVHFEGSGTLSGWWQYYTGSAGTLAKGRVAEGAVLQSVGGKKYMLTVSDAGVLSTILTA